MKDRAATAPYLAAGHSQENAQALAGLDAQFTALERHQALAKVRTRVLPIKSTPLVRRAEASGKPRASASRSSARSGDSGDDDPSEPPSRRRLCPFCGHDIPVDLSAQAKYCSGKHAAADRQRRKRERDRERDLGPRVPTTADERKMLAFDFGEYERLLKFATCRCNGHHILERDEKLGDRCLKCGRQRPGPAVGRVMRTVLGLKAVVA